MSATRPVDLPRYTRRTGRPPTKGTQYTSVKLSPEDRDLLEQLAGAEDVPLGTIWRRALHTYANAVGFVAHLERPLA